MSYEKHCRYLGSVIRKGHESMPCRTSENVSVQVVFECQFETCAKDNVFKATRVNGTTRETIEKYDCYCIGLLLRNEQKTTN